MQAEGISPEEITIVVLTHGHPDHIGGVLDANRKPAFPNARYVMSRTEWNLWTGDPNLNSTGLNDHLKELLIKCALTNLPPLEERIELLDGEKEVVPGVYAIPAPGHTPGHLALVVSSSKAQLLHVAEAVLHPMNLEYPAWRNVFDLNEDGAATTRQRLLDRAAADDAAVVAYHFPFPGLGRVRNNGTAWRWGSCESGLGTPFWSGSPDATLCHSEASFMDTRSVLAAGGEPADSLREMPRFGMTIALGFSNYTATSLQPDRYKTSSTGYLSSTPPARPAGRW